MLIDNFLKVMSFYEKFGIIESVETWQLYRTTRNLAAHDYETVYAGKTDHFNALHELIPAIYNDARKLTSYCEKTLSIIPNDTDFKQDFIEITHIKTCMGANGV